MRMKRSLLSAAAVGLLAAAAQSAFGQAEVQRFERQLEQIQRDYRLKINPDVPAGQRALLDYGGYLSLNYLAIDDIQQDTHQLRQYDLVGYARLNIDNVHEFFLRARTSYRDFNQGESFDGEGDEKLPPTIEQAYYRFDLSRYLSAYKGQTSTTNFVFTGGRQFVYWANGLVLAQTLDGANIDLSFGNLAITVLGGTTAHKTVDFDASRPQFDDHTERGFFGAIASYQIGRHRPFAYALIQRDYNPDPLDVSVSPTTTTHFNYNSWYLGFGSNGSIGDRLLYGAEVVYEGGHGLSTSFDPDTLLPLDQKNDTIQAGAADFKLDYLLADTHRSRLSVESILATGDHDRSQTSNTFGGNLPNSNDHAFNAFGLLNTGLAFAPNISNIAMLRVGGSTFPFGNSGTFRRLQVGADVLFYCKFYEGAPIDEATSDDRYLGFEPDVYLNWQITSDITFALRYGVFFPGSAIVNDDSPRNFFFAGVTFAF
jgi:hypothetical protein